jgi:O-antigen/teichoic acid export membrane protein
MFGGGTQASSSLMQSRVPTPEEHEGGTAIEDEMEAGRLARDSIRARVLSGAALIAVRGVLLLALAAVANAVLAHELSPHAFGIVAFGMTVMTFAAVFSDGGLGAALIRSAVPVERSLLQAIFGLQLWISAALFVLICIVAVPFFGQAGSVTAVMALALPLGALDTPAKIMLERRLEYRVLARAEVLQAVVYYTWAVVAVSIGFGVWGLASAAVVRVIAIAVILYAARPDLFMLPMFSIARVRPLLRFGIGFQANNVVNVFRDEGLNLGIAAIVGIAPLGIWTLARRLMELPMLLFQTLWRVSFPATSQLLAAGGEPRRLIARAARLTAVASAFLLGALAAAAPGLVGSVFGSRWTEVGTLVAIACAPLVYSGPVSVATAGYLYAVGDSSSVLIASVAHTVAWLGVSMALLPSIGIVAVPIGWVIGSAVDAWLLAVSARRHSGVWVFSAVWVPSTAGLLAGGVGLACDVLLGRTLTGGFAGGIVAVALCAVLLIALRRTALEELLELVRQRTRGGVAAHAAP